MKASSGFLKWIARNRDLMALAISILAIVFSQLTPVYTWNDRPNTEIETKDSAEIWHQFNRSGIDVFVSLRNTGSKKDIVSRVGAAILSRQTLEIIKRLEAKTYLEIEVDEFAYPPQRWDPLSEIPLDTMGTWNHTCSLEFTVQRDLRTEIDSLMMEITSNMEDQLAVYEAKLEKENISEDTRLQREIEFKNSFILEEPYYDRLTELLNKSFDWLKTGKYLLAVFTISKTHQTRTMSSFQVYGFDITPVVLQEYFKKYIRYRHPWQYPGFGNKKGVDVNLTELKDNGSTKRIREIVESNVREQGDWL